MIKLQDLDKRESLYKLIDQEISLLFNFINFESSKIEIHINLPGEEDYARGAFTLFGLSMAYKSGFKNNIDIKSIINLFDKLHAKSLVSKNNNHIYLILYGIRMRNNLGLDYQDLLEEFKKENMSTIYSYPVLTYIYMSAYKECKLMSEDKFLQSVYLQAHNTFEFIIYSSHKDKFLPFHFAELSNIDEDLGVRADIIMREKFKFGYPDNSAYTSGVAKCLEHYTRAKDNAMIKRCVDFINTRSLSLNSEYLKPDLKANMNNLYRETNSSNYICLDTNTHLLLSYLNLYAHIK